MRPTMLIYRHSRLQREKIASSAKLKERKKHKRKFIAEQILTLCRNDNFVRFHRIRFAHLNFFFVPLLILSCVVYRLSYTFSSHCVQFTDTRTESSSIDFYKKKKRFLFKFPSMSLTSTSSVCVRLQMGASPNANLTVYLGYNHIWMRAFDSFMGTNSSRRHDDDAKWNDWLPIIIE